MHAVRQRYGSLVAQRGRLWQNLVPGRFALGRGRLIPHPRVLITWPVDSEFQVALWYRNFSGNDGPVAYSTWSNTVNVK